MISRRKLSEIAAEYPASGARFVGQFSLNYAHALKKTTCLAWETLLHLEFFILLISAKLGSLVRIHHAESDFLKNFQVKRTTPSFW